MNHRFVAVMATACVLVGCRAKEVTPHDRELAANDLSEAQFAVTLKDWPRAEDLFNKASQLVPDDGDTWMNLGVSRMHLSDRSGAKSAYKTALSAFREGYKLHPEQASQVIDGATVLIILGRVDEARELVDKALAQHPDDRKLKNFVDQKGVDVIAARPSLKEISP